MAAFGYIIFSNGIAVAICIGTPAEAEASCKRLKEANDRIYEREYGRLAEHLSPSIQWEVKKVPILI